MAHPDILDLVGAIYDAAGGGLDWPEIGERLCRVFDAQRVYLGIEQPDGTLPNLLREPEPADLAYAAYYHKVDPFRLRSAAAAARGLPIPAVQRGSEIVPVQELIRSEYYLDYARYRGVRHSLGGQLDTTGRSLLGLFRDSPGAPFNEREIHDLGRLLPHLNRGLQLRRALALPPAAPRTSGFEILDALPFCIILVDAQLQVVFMNRMAEQLTTRAGSGLRVIAAGPLGAGRPKLAGLQPASSRALRTLIEAAAAGAPGGALRLPGRAQDATRPQATSVLISPAPARLTVPAMHDDQGAVAPGLALLVARDLASPVIPPSTHLQDLFGLSSGEAAVATALLGGRTAEQVARTRHVSLETVRRQIQTVLRKSEAANLRDFERIAASVALMHSRPAITDHRQVLPTC